MLVADFDYDLPHELIAQEPLARREDSRLMVVRRRSRTIEDHSFCELEQLLGPRDTLVVNNARVLKARLHARKEPGGGRVELLLVARKGDTLWEAMVKPARRIRDGTSLVLDCGERVRVEGEGRGAYRLVRFAGADRADAIMKAHGETPLPPYIHQPSSVDDERYQTVYAERAGAVAAPTAGLHFSRDLLDRLRHRGVETVAVTLDVGPGTFLPLRKAVVEENRLHREAYEVSQDAAEALRRAVLTRRRVVAVGTTSLRVLESLGPEGVRSGRPRRGETELFVHPGVDLHVVSGLVTNFHLPRTSLLCLVAAVAGTDLWRQAYERAVRQRYRFYSFGDAMFITD